MKAGVVGTGSSASCTSRRCAASGSRSAGVVASSPDRARAEAGPARAVRESRRAARGRRRRRRPHHDTEPPAPSPGQGGARRGQARRLREAARADLGGDGGTDAARRARAASSTARATTSASTASAARRATAIRAGSSAASSTWTAATSRTGCSKDTDWNWRLDPEHGGALRAVADIGSHWLDLVLRDRQAGRERSRDLATWTPSGVCPTGPVETFSAGDDDVERVEREMKSEDLATCCFASRRRARLPRRLGGERRPQ